MAYLIFIERLRSLLLRRLINTALVAVPKMEAPAPSP
jgi:hypothetical protein